MSTVVVTVAILALAEAGYQYNTPSASFVLPGNQLANFQTGHVSQNIAPINSGYSQPSSLLGVDSKSGNTHFLRPAAGLNLNTGYAQTPSASTATHLNSAYANPFVSTVSNNLNSGHIKNYMLPASAHFNSGHVENFASFGTLGLNVGKAQTIIPASSSNLLQHNAGSNLGYPKSSNPLVSVNLNTGYAQNFVQPSLGQGYSQPFMQSVAGNLNTGYSQTPAAIVAAGSNNGLYAQKWIPFTAGNLNSGYSQTLAPSSTSSLSNGYAQNWIPSPSTSNRNSDYPQSFASSGTPSATQSTINLNTGYSQTLVPPGTATSSNSKSLLSSGTVGLSQGYSQLVIPPANANLNTGYSQNILPSSSGDSQIPPPHVSTNLNTGYTQPFSSPASVASSSHSQISTLTSNNNPGYVQNLIAQSSSSFGAPANNIQTTGSNAWANGYSRPEGVSNGVPVNVPSTIYKHVYFHVPPPEDEQQAVRPAPPQKKNYKIVFIKVPSQERNLQQIAQIRNNAAAPVEHKTLIYVLVKKPEAEQPTVAPKGNPSEHEVFFVKYNGNPLDIAAQVNGELDKSGSVKSIVPLEPGLVNGQK